MTKFNKELLLREDVCIRITSAKEFQTLLDWCKEAFDYWDIDRYYNSWKNRDVEYIKLNNITWNWNVIPQTKKVVSYEDALLTENNTQPKLEPGMLVVLKSKTSDILYTCLHISYKWNPTIDNKGYCDLTVDHYDIVEIYNLNRRSTLDTIDTTFATLLWKKEDDKKDKLQENPTTLEESHKQAVTEIKKEPEEM